MVLLILAGITITYVMGDNSVFKKASDAKLKIDIAKWQEMLETAKTPIIIEGLGKFDPDKYFDYIEKQGIIEDKETDVVDNGNGTYDVTVKPGYIFEVELLPSQDNSKDAKIEYIGQAGKIAPIIKRIETSATSSSITAKAIVTRLGNGTVTYYYKLKSEADSEYKEITNVNNEAGATQTAGITAGEEYVIEVVAKNEAGEVSDTAEITATKVSVESITITPNPATVKEGKTVALVAKVKPDNATNKGVTWESSNTAIAIVDENGRVTGKNVGTVTITANATDGSNHSASCTVTVKELTVADIVGEAQTSNRTIKDENGNKIVIPGGFRVVPDTKENDVDYTYLGDKRPCVQDGIVIEDEEGNQFVWIPVGSIKNKDNTTTAITLGRYAGVKVEELKQKASDYTKKVVIQQQGFNMKYVELTNDSGNIAAKNLNSFISKTNISGGYYFGRCEASKGNDGKVDSKFDKAVWEGASQSMAATASRKMYSSSYVESDLINSYSWDTAIVLIQEYSNEKTYGWTTSKNSSFVSTGKSGDKQLNIYDMASNYQEWTTEHCDGVSESDTCTYRGGQASRGTVNGYTSYRYCGSGVSTERSLLPTYFVSEIAFIVMFLF